jgi:hypothetical protein
MIFEMLYKIPVLAAAIWITIQGLNLIFSGSYVVGIGLVIVGTLLWSQIRRWF